MKRRRLQRCSWSLHDSLNLLLEGVHALFETHRGNWFNGSWFNALRRNRRWLGDFWAGRRLDRGLGGFVLERNLLFPRRGFLLCFPRLGRLGLHQLDGIKMVVDVFVFRTFDGTIRCMCDVAEIFDEDCVNAYNRMLFVLSLHHIPEGQASN